MSLLKVLTIIKSRIFLLKYVKKLQFSWF